MSNRKKNKLLVPCECAGTCSSLVIEYWDDLHPEERAVSISHLSSSWNSLQGNSWNKFTKTMKMILLLLRGKEYYFYEIYIEDKAKMEEFKAFVANIDTSGMVDHE